MTDTVRIKTEANPDLRHDYRQMPNDELARIQRRLRNQRTRDFFSKTNRHDTRPRCHGDYADVPRELVQGQKATT